ncbi:MAG: hypothetical protein WAN65_28990, partial [Candidatus Sulfotelmatobacter sp.]
LVDLEGGKPIPITPEGIAGGLISPDGRYVIRDVEVGSKFLAVCPVEGGPARPIPNLGPYFAAIRWSEDNSFVYGFFRNRVPTELYKVNLATGTKSLLQELQPESAGVVYISPVVVTPDGSRSAFTYRQVSSVLSVVSGLH